MHTDHFKWRAISFIWLFIFQPNKYEATHWKRREGERERREKKMPNVANHMKRKAVILLLFVLDLCSPLSLLYSFFFSLLLISFSHSFSFSHSIFVIWFEINRTCLHTAAQKKYTHNCLRVHFGLALYFSNIIYTLYMHSIYLCM